MNEEKTIEVLFSSADRANAIYNDFFTGTTILRVNITTFKLAPEFWETEQGETDFCDFLEALEEACVEIR